MILLIDLSLGLYEPHFCWTKDQYLDRFFGDKKYFYWGNNNLLNDKFKYLEILSITEKQLFDEIQNISQIYILNLDGSTLNKNKFSKYCPNKVLIKKVKFFNCSDFNWPKSRIEAIKNYWKNNFHRLLFERAMKITQDRDDYFEVLEKFSEYRRNLTPDKISDENNHTILDGNHFIILDKNYRKIADDKTMFNNISDNFFILMEHLNNIKNIEEWDKKLQQENISINELASDKSLKSIQDNEEQISQREDIIKHLWGGNFMDAWASKVLSDIKDKQVLLIGEYVTPLILAISAGLNHPIVYKRKFTKININKQSFEIINDIKYLKFLNSYYKDAFDLLPAFYGTYQDEDFSTFLFRKALWEKFNFNDRYFFKLLFDFRDQNQKMELIGDNQYLIEKIIKALRKYSGHIFTFDCSDGEYKISEKKDGLVFFQVDKLTRAKISNLVEELMDGEYKNKPVIFIVSQEFEIPHLEDIKKIYIPSAVGITENLSRFFPIILNEKNLFQTKEDRLLFESIYSHLMNGRLLEDFFISYPSLDKVEKYLENIGNDYKIQKDVLHHDFWYEFINYFESKQQGTNKEAEVLVTNIENVEDDRDWIKFEHLKGDKYWYITSNTRKIYKSQRYKGSKGIKFIAYLSQYYPRPESINPEELVKKINQWNNVNLEKKYKTELDHLIDVSIRNDLKKISPSITDYIDCFEISEKCFYYPQSRVRIIIEDEEMPPKE